jgi:hypothetical protein
VQGVGTDYKGAMRAATAGATEFCYDTQTEDRNVLCKRTVRILSAWVAATHYSTTNLVHVHLSHF